MCSLQVTASVLSAPERCASVIFHMAPDRDESSWKALGELSTVGITLVLSTVIGMVAGYYLDRWLGTRPWLFMVGLLLGIAAGFVSLFRTVKDSERDIE